MRTPYVGNHWDRKTPCQGNCWVILVPYMVLVSFSQSGKFTWKIQRKPENNPLFSQIGDYQKFPVKKAEIVANLGNSPRTRKILSKKRHATYSQRRERSLSIESSGRRPERGNKSSKKRQLQNWESCLFSHEVSNIGRNVQKRRAQKTLAKMLALERCSVKAGINKRE